MSPATREITAKPRFCMACMLLGNTTMILLSVLIFSFICWFYNLNTKQTNSLQRIVNFSSKINLCLVIKLQLYPCYVTKIFYQKWNLFQRTPTEHALYRKFEHLPHELRCMMFRSLAHNINCSLTPQQGMIRD